ncbi:MAG TPA: hypothetical protein VGK20_01115 [Candidatus Binatia bacterium]|jgi:hypothetical protein
MANRIIERLGGFASAWFQNWTTLAPILSGAAGLAMAAWAYLAEQPAPVAVVIGLCTVAVVLAIFLAALDLRDRVRLWRGPRLRITAADPGQIVQETFVTIHNDGKPDTFTAHLGFRLKDGGQIRCKARWRGTNETAIHIGTNHFEDLLISASELIPKGTQDLFDTTAPEFVGTKFKVLTADAFPGNVRHAWVRMHGDEEGPDPVTIFLRILPTDVPEAALMTRLVLRMYTWGWTQLNLASDLTGPTSSAPSLE